MHPHPPRSIILETDPQVIAARVRMQGAEGESPVVEQVGRSPIGLIGTCWMMISLIININGMMVLAGVRGSLLPAWTAAEDSFWEGLCLDVQSDVGVLFGGSRSKHVDGQPRP